MTPSTNPEERFIVGLEIGSSRAKIGVAGFDPTDTGGELTVYSATSLSTVDSVRYGRITNIRDVEDVIKRLVKSVESTYPVEGRRVLGVYVNIGGRTLKSRKISARSEQPDRSEITSDMLARLKDDALATLPSNVEVVCTEPLRFSVDNILTPRPVGTLGSRLAGEFTAVVCSPSNKEDLRNVILDRVGLSICGLAVRPVAVANLVLSKAETNAGCMLVDIGAETITVAIYRGFALHYLATIPIGARLITRDLAATLAITEDEAENLKCTIGDAMPEPTDDQLRKTVNTVITARLADLMANIAAQPGFAGLQPEQLRGGIILTGGGAKLRNFGRLLENYTRLKVRIATLPPNIAIADPSLSATDYLDLIALLNDAVNDARRNPDAECLSPRPEPVRKPEPVVIDLTEPGDQEKIEHYGYDPEDFQSVKTPEDEVDYEDGNTGNYDEYTDDGVDDLLDYDEAEKQRRRRQEREREKAKKTKKKAPKRDNDRPGLVDKVISRLTGLLNGGNDDNSADLDE